MNHLKIFHKPLKDRLTAEELFRVSQSIARKVRNGPAGYMITHPELAKELEKAFNERNKIRNISETLKE